MYWISLTILSLLANAGLLLWALRLRSQVPETIKDLRALYETRAADLQILNAGLAAELEQLRPRCNELTAEVERIQLKCNSYFGQIESACQQRQFWQAWYHRQASEHAGAQGYLMRAIEGLVVQLKRATGKAPPLDKMLHEVVQQFRETHPGLADAGQAADSVPARDPELASAATGEPNESA